MPAPPPLQVFACTNFLAMFFPRAAAMFELLQHVYEAQALFCFGALLLDLAAGARRVQRCRTAWRGTAPCSR